MITRFALEILAMAIFVSIVVLLGLALQPMPMVERDYATLEAFKGGDHYAQNLNLSGQEVEGSSRQNSGACNGAAPLITPIDY